MNIRRSSAAVGALGLIAVLTGCASSTGSPVFDPEQTAGASSGSYERETGEDTSWGVGATDPRYESLSPCSEDPSIETAVQSADLPSSRLGMRLVPGSTEADALRIADCLAIALTGGQIWISAPAD
ncbi:hypothetical protein [Salinibacterium sp. ZJ454]|uniref:hypothetical protein n=1 Tax=Salinibacterium sp. ZJ454 TaxID=2708339 RepID=UPI00142448EE|nr:hypothetical protein [Salinibacterium sp. ZJ454]